MEHRNICPDSVSVQWQEADGQIEEIEASVQGDSASRVCLQIDRPIPEHTGLRLLSLNGESNREFSGR